MKTGFITWEDFHDRKDIASSRIRAKWVAKYWQGAEMYVPGQKYDVEIFQKVYWTGHMKASSAIKILDICDPDFLETQSLFFDALEYADAITFPTQAFHDYLCKITDKPLKLVPDRLDLELFTAKKQHTEKAKKVVWFGYAQNQGCLNQTADTLRKLGLKLTIVSDDARVYLKKLEDAKLYDFVKYNQQSAFADIMEAGDIALLPPFQEPSYSRTFKSNNKEITAWSLGLPVAKNAEELEYYLDPEHRRQAVAENWVQMKAVYDARLSVVDYLDVIKQVINGKS